MKPTEKKWKAQLYNSIVIALGIAVAVSATTVFFIGFLPTINHETMLITAVVSFIMTYFLVYYLIDIVIFEEIQNLNQNINRLSTGEPKSVHPIKKLNEDIRDFLKNKETEVDDLRKAEKFRTEFVADLSHELKTPIFAAQSFINTLQDGAKENPEVRDRFLRKASKSLDILDALVKDLVELSQIESGDQKMHIEQVDMLRVCVDVFEQVEIAAKELGANLKLKAKKTNKNLVWADPIRIEQVIKNLVVNALKYGQKGGDVMVKLTEIADNKLEISVTNSGPIIAEEHIGRIFERFYRIDKSRSRETGGTGLGLSIVKHILNKHGSSIQVRSSAETGTVFSFTLNRLGDEPTTLLEKLIEKSTNTDAPLL